MTHRDGFCCFLCLTHICTVDVWLSDLHCLRSSVYLACLPHIAGSAYRRCRSLCPQLPVGSSGAGLLGLSVPWIPESMLFFGHPPIPLWPGFIALGYFIIQRKPKMVAGTRYHTFYFRIPSSSPVFRRSYSLLPVSSHLLVLLQIRQFPNRAVQKLSLRIGI